MSVQVQAVRLITAEMAREHIEDALRIVDELEIADDLREPAFVQACTMLGARATVAEPPRTFDIPPDVLGIRRQNG